MAFYRYRHKEAAGPGPWEFIESGLSERDLAEELMNDPYSGYSCGEHYRGVDIERVVQPPDEWLKDRIDSMKGTIKRCEESIRRYSVMLDD